MVFSGCSVSFALVVCIGALIHVTVNCKGDSKHQIEQDENSSHRYLETDIEYVYKDSPPQDVKFYDKLDENMLKAMFPEEDWTLHGLDQLTEEEKTTNLETALANINQQNKAYKEKKSSFFSGPTPLSILGRQAKGLRRKEVQGQIGQNSYKETNMERMGLMLSKIRKNGSPPSEFHTSKTKLTSVKNQGKCNACGIFALIAVIETGLLIQNSTLDNSKLDLSEQAVLNCFVEKKDDDGCNGVRNISAIMEYIINERNGSLPSESQYPYKHFQYKDECPPLTENCFSGIQVSGYKFFEEVGEKEMMELVVNHGAVVVTIAFGKLTENYKGGIFDECSVDAAVDHAVTVVGYGESNGKKYWKVKNSYGKDWGEDGYVRIERGINCMRIEERVLVPILTRIENETYFIHCIRPFEWNAWDATIIIIFIIILLVIKVQRKCKDFC